MRGEQAGAALVSRGREQDRRKRIGGGAPACTVVVSVHVHIHDHVHVYDHAGVDVCAKADEAIHPGGIALGPDFPRKHSSRRRQKFIDAAIIGVSVCRVLSVPTSTSGGAPMGDKSPKANDKNKKQADANKNAKKSAAVTKATPAPAPAKKGK